MAERIEIPDDVPATGRRERTARRDHGRGPWARRGDRPRVLVAPARRWRSSRGPNATSRPSPTSCPAETLVFSGDVRDADFNEAVADGVVAEWGGVDVWICNAGISPIVAGPLGDRAGGVARRDRRQPHRRVPRRPRRGPRDGRRRPADLHRLGPRRTTAQGTHRLQRVEGRASSAWPRAWPSTSHRPGSPSTSCRPAGSSRRSPTGSPTTSGWPSRSSDTRRMRRWGRSADLAGAFQFLASDASAFITGDGHPRRRRIRSSYEPRLDSSRG